MTVSTAVVATVVVIVVIVVVVVRVLKIKQINSKQVSSYLNHNLFLIQRDVVVSLWMFAAFSLHLAFLITTPMTKNVFTVSILKLV